MAEPFRQVDLVEVRLDGRPVGVVATDPTTRLPVFQYEPSWVADGLDLAPLHLPRDRAPRSFPALARTSFRGLPGLLADSLPGLFADTLTNAWLAQRGVQPGEVTATDRLAYLGSRAMGALTFHPAAGPADAHRATAFQLAAATDTARRALTGQLTDQDALQYLLDISGSAGGTRPKVLLATDGHGAYRSGQLDAPAGWEHWLVKLDVTRHTPPGEPSGLGRLEYAYHLMAIDAGLSMSPCRLIHDGDLAHFATRRFDRPGPDVRRHVQSLAAIEHLPPEHAGAHTYEQYLQACQRLGLGPGELGAAFRQIVFNIAGANRDDHTKNLAFLHDGHGWRLAPSFDLTFPYDTDGGWPVAHQMTVNGSPHGADRNTLLRLADRAKIPPRSAISVLDQVTAAVDRWSDHAEAAGVHVRHRAEVQQQLTRTALAD